MPSITRRSATALLAAAAFGARGSAWAADPTPVRGGTLTVLLPSDPGLLTSGLSTNLIVGAVTNKVYDGLVAYDLDMNLVPKLAESWEFSPDGLSYRFNLAKGVTWHDGKPFTSADVAFSVEEVWRKLHPRSRISFGSVTSVETPDEHTAILRLSTPTPQLWSALNSLEAPVMPKHIFAGTDIPANPAVNAPVGTGPFMFKEWKRGEYILLERNPSYRIRHEPYLDRVVFRIAPDAQGRLTALETGEAQLSVLTPVPLIELDRLSKSPNAAVETRGYEYMAPMFLMEFNLRRGPTADLKVRQAIAHAIDRAALVKTVWYGYGTPATGPVPSTATRFYTQDGVPAYPFDRRRAEALLDEAGYKRGPDGTRFKIFHDFLPYGADYQRNAEFLKQQLGRVGIELVIRGQDLPSFFKRVFTDYDYDTTVNIFGAFPDPTQGVQRVYYSKTAQKGVVFVNSTGYANPQMDALWESAQRENDFGKRKADFAAIQRIAMADLPVLPLFEFKWQTVASRRLHGHTITADGAIGTDLAGAWLQPA